MKDGVLERERGVVRGREAEAMVSSDAQREKKKAQELQMKSEDVYHWEKIWCYADRKTGEYKPMTFLGSFHSDEAIMDCGLLEGQKGCSRTRRMLRS
ncbi:hypothetical protein L1049_011289 [Liquidambar formosana]|uniref:Uncharacterized protein n=1 Tax=Liquidambar formosana TaxID=63359 RepID=A0AAP0WZN8_LIQFO